MSGNASRYSGVAMITAVPFNAQGSIDVDEYRRQIDHQIEAGVSIVQCPLADELYYLSEDECLLIMRTLAASTRNSALSCAIVSHSPNIEKIVEYARRYEDSGIDILKILSPLHYALDFNPSDVYDYYARVIEAVGTRVMIYNQPRRCGANVPPEIIARLAKEYPRVVMLEDSNFAQVVDVRARLGDRLGIFTKFPSWVPANSLGCRGLYSWQPFAPAATQELFMLCNANRYDDARALFFERYDLYSLSLMRGVSGMKFGLKEIGFDTGKARAPLHSDLSRTEVHHFRAVLGKYGLLG